MTTWVSTTMIGRSDACGEGWNIRPSLTAALVPKTLTLYNRRLSAFWAAVLPWAHVNAPVVRAVWRGSLTSNGNKS
jgi:hypothetical protein